MARGYFGIAIYQPKTVANIGTLWRSANLMGANFLAVIGKRYKRQSSDTMKSDKHIPLFEYNNFDDFYKNLPKGCQLWGIELDSRAHLLGTKIHPQQVCYLLGAEDNGLPESILQKCVSIIKLDTERSLNVAVAGSIVMYSRLMNADNKG